MAPTHNAALPMEAGLSSMLLVALELVRQETDAKARDGFLVFDYEDDQLDVNAGHDTTEGGCGTSIRETLKKEEELAQLNRREVHDSAPAVTAVLSESSAASRLLSRHFAATEEKTIKEEPQSSARIVEDDVACHSSDDGANAKFILPRPTALEGVKSRKKVILRMEDVSFCHGATDKPIVKNATLAMSQASRMLVVGETLPEKTTLSKILTGEEAPTEGALMTVAGLRVSCIAAHVVQRLDEHAHKTPEQYIMWRFVGNVDREGMRFRKFADSRSMTQSSPRQMASAYVQRFLMSFGVSLELAARTQIAQLSASMKVRVCLAASMWQSPHVLILEEPAELFTPGDLHALLSAISNYKGGLLITARTEDQAIFESNFMDKWSLAGDELRRESSEHNQAHKGVGLQSNTVVDNDRDRVPAASAAVATAKGVAESCSAKADQ